MCKGRAKKKENKIIARKRKINYDNKTNECMAHSTVNEI